MAELKTKSNEASVTAFLNKIEDEEKRTGSFEILKLMQQVTKQEPKMWGTSIIGFGNTHLKYASGRELDWFIMGFSPRKQNLTLYGLGGFNQHTDLMKKLGKHKAGTGCLYIKKLSDVDKKVLQELITESFKNAHRSE